MNDKVTLQAISDIFASQYGLSKKTTEAFGKTFFDTIVDGLNADGVVKINGLGTFKIVEVGSRESVNVTNGERIVIDGYRKVAFTPDELAEQKLAEAIADVEAAVDKVAVEATEEVQNVVLDENAVPEKVEVPADDFSGIDFLISTPESICEVEKDLSLARIRAEQTLEEAKRANVEYRRLEMLLERLKANVVPENVDPEAAKASVSAALAAVVAHHEEPISVELPEPESQAEEVETSEDVTQAEEQVAEQSEQQSDEPDVEQPETEAIEVEEPKEPVEESEEPTKESEEPTKESEEPTKESEEAVEEEDTSKKNNVYYDDDEDDDDDSSNVRLWILIPLVGILIAIASIFAYRWMKYRVPEDEFFTENVIDDKLQDSVSNAVLEQKEDTIKKEDLEKAAEKKAAEEKAKADQIDAEKKAAEEKAKAEQIAAEKKAAEEKAKAEKAKQEAAKKAAEEKAAKASKPKVHTMLKGENLYQISKKYYGTFDSVRSIIRINKFPDPNNVPIGQEIKLP